MIGVQSKTPTKQETTCFLFIGGDAKIEVTGHIASSIFGG